MKLIVTLAVKALLVTDRACKAKLQLSYALEQRRGQFSKIFFNLNIVHFYSIKILKLNFNNFDIL